MDLDIKQIKALCKKKKCTINDYMTATIGTTLYEYFENHKNEGFKTPNHVDAMIPFSFRKPV